MARKHYEWKLRNKTLRLGERTLVMSVLNVTPDSFSDGGKYLDPDRAFARALELEEQGADIIDIGAESTRPGSTRVSEAEELRRLIPVLKRLEGRLTIPLSVDTYKSAVATKALELGADIINDPTGLTFDADLARVAAKVNAGLILNHMRGAPETWAKLPPLKDPISTIGQELDSAMHRAVRAGVDRKYIVIDPGLGFGKRKEQNSEILARLGELKALDLPLAVGASRKHFVAKPSEGETEFASAAAVTAAILNGAHIVRVHDVVAMKAVIEVADEIARASAEREEAELAAKAELREEAKRERASGPRRGASPYREEQAPSRKFSVPVVTGVVRGSGFSPLRPAVKPVFPPPSVEAQELELAKSAEIQDDSLPAYETGALQTTAGELPSFDTEFDLDAPDDLNLDDEVPAEYSSPAPVKRAAPAPAAQRPSAARGPKKEWDAKPKGFKPAGSRPPFQGRFDRREDDDRRGPRPSGPRPSGPREGPPAGRGAYSRTGPSDTRRPFDRDKAPRDSGARNSASREGTGERERPPFRGKPAFGKPSFGKKPAFGKKPFGKSAPGEKPFGRKPFGDRAESGERPAFGPKKTFGDKPSFGPRKSFGGKPSFGRKPFGDKAESGERPAFGPRKTFGGKPSFGPKKTFGGKPSFGRKPGGKFSGGPGGRPTGKPGGKPSGRSPGRG